VVVAVVVVVMMPMMMVMMPVIGCRRRAGVRNGRHHSEHEKSQ